MYINRDEGDETGRERRERREKKKKSAAAHEEVIATEGVGLQEELQEAEDRLPRESSTTGTRESQVWASGEGRIPQRADPGQTVTWRKTAYSQAAEQQRKGHCSSGRRPRQQGEDGKS